MITSNSKIPETKSPSRAIANAIVQPKLNVSTPGDRYEVEADRAAAQVVAGISDNSPKVSSQQKTSGDVDITRLQRHEEDEEAQTKIQKQCCEEEEEAQMKLQRQPEEEEEELQTKLQKQEEEEEELQAKIQRQAEEEEEEELQTKLQRQAEEEEEELIQAKNENDTRAHKQHTNGMVEQRINQRRGGGSPMTQNIQREMEGGFGNNFSNVRIHRDAEASKMSSAMNAQAFTTSNDIYFNEGKYKPDDNSGKSLLAHELSHVIQQNGKNGDISRKTSAGVTAGNIMVEDASGMDEKHISIQKQEDTKVQLVGEEAPIDAPTPEPDTHPTPEPDSPPVEAATPEPAVPTLNLTPGNTLTRGDNFKATFMFQPTGAETYRITAWTFTSDEHGIVSRRASDADFQNKWGGIMAMSGILEVTYRITPDGGEEGAEASLTEDITVNDRTGTGWEAITQQNAEGAMAGSPSPPVVFSDLGHHDVQVQMPALTLSTISEGPNRRLRFVESLTAGIYSSTPTIHPDLNDNTSTFHTFHQHPGRLFLVVGTTKTLISPSEYSNLSVQGSSISFDVPDWETFYKTHNVYEITATANGNTFTLPDSAWVLDSNSEDAQVAISDENAIRQGLNIGPDDEYEPHINVRGSWSGHEMMQAAAILTGTQSHEYVDTTHSHRANFLKMMSALEPEKMIEKKVSAPGHTLNHNTILSTWETEILEPNHEIVDEQASTDAEEFVAETGNTMAGVNTDPGSGAFLGSIWNISGDAEMTN